MTAAIPMSWPGRAAAVAIEAYQRFISPYKGFCCAHRALHRRKSCSEFGKRVALRRGIVGMVPLLWGRFRACGAAARTLVRWRQVLVYESKQPAEQRGPGRSRSAGCASGVTPDGCGGHVAQMAVDGACHCGPELACDLLSGI